MTTSPPSASEWRFGADPSLPEWARGKSAAEVLAVAQGYHEAFNRGGLTQNVPASAAPAAPAPVGQPLDDEAILTGKDWNRLSREALETYVAPQLRQSMEMSASNAYGLTAQKHAKEFQRYGPEIQLELAKVPKQYWTLDNLETVVTLIKGRHSDDLARERAQELVAQMEPTIRPTGGGAVPPPDAAAVSTSLESDKIPSDWKIRAKRAGITEATVREFCATNDMTPEDFFKLFEKSPLQPIVAEVT